MFNVFIEDYGPGPYSIIFPSGETRQGFGFAVEEDDILESNEVFSFIIDPSSLPSGVTIGNFGIANITILDNECESNGMDWYTNTIPCKRL